tara:strand:+ start:2026 stop:3306 length:1281 start_codon:yes stop_codon:yes gene_type:complete
MFSRNKLIFYSIILAIVLIFTINLKTIKNLIPIQTKNKIMEIVFSEKFIKDLELLNKYAYNKNTFPQTQFLNLNYKTKKVFNENETLDQLEKLSDYSFLGTIYNTFFVEIWEENLFIVGKDSKIFTSKKDDLSNEETYLTKNEIKNNLNELFNYVLPVHGFLIFEDKLYLSVQTKDKSHTEEGACFNFQILSAEVSTKFLKFENFFKSNSCDEFIYGGKMVGYNNDGIKGILFSTGNKFKMTEAQSEESDFGKIIFVSFDDKEKEIFASGFRNVLGISADENIIITSSMGPRGGDEINVIKKGKNYGWPIASYGEPYGENLPKYKFAKDHHANNFEEPIFTFIPSVAPAEIIKIPDRFNSKWKNNYFLASLGAKSLYRLKLNQNYDGILYMEKILIGERIRDINYDEQSNSFILAIESGEISVIKN